MKLPGGRVAGVRSRVRMLTPGFGQHKQAPARTGTIPVHLRELVTHDGRNVFDKQEGGESGRAGWRARVDGAGDGSRASAPPRRRHRRLGANRPRAGSSRRTASSGPRVFEPAARRPGRRSGARSSQSPGGRFAAHGESGSRPASASPTRPGRRRSPGADRGRPPPGRARTGGVRGRSRPGRPERRTA